MREGIEENKSKRYCVKAISSESIEIGINGCPYRPEEWNNPLRGFRGSAACICFFWRQSQFPRRKPFFRQHVDQDKQCWGLFWDFLDFEFVCLQHVHIVSEPGVPLFFVQVDGSLMTVNLGQLAPPPRPRNCPSDQQNHFSNDIPAPLSDPSINDKLPNAPSQPAITHPLSAPSVPPSYGSSPTLATQGNSHFLPTPSQMYEPLAPAQDKNSKAPWDPTKGGAPPAAMYPSIGAVNDCVGPAVHHGTTNTAPGYAGMAYQTVCRNDILILLSCIVVLCMTMSRYPRI